MEQQGQFEFSTTHNLLIGTLAKKMTWVAYFLFLTAVLFALGTLLAFEAVGPGGLVQAALMIIIGIWTKKAAGAFGQIVNTAGSDISNLMDALGELKRLYTLQYWVFIIAAILVGIGVIVGVMAAM